jgi:hypothetical protein
VHGGEKNKCLCASKGEIVSVCVNKVNIYKYMCMCVCVYIYIYIY